MQFKQTELHRHLDISIRHQTLLEYLQKYNVVPQSTSLDVLKDQIILKKPMKNLSEVIKAFEAVIEIFRSPETLKRIAYEATLDCVHEGTQRIEFRYSPSFVCNKFNLDWKEVLISIHDGIQDGIKSAQKNFSTQIEVGLICIISREFGMDDAEKTTEFFLNNSSYFCGIDLAGDEANYPARLFQSLFDQVRLHYNKQNRLAPITIHAGEASGPENVWESIELLGAQRIGHGIRSVDDPKLLDFLKKKQICLEVCPTSNWLTNACKSLKSHPLPLLIQHGVPVCINTDDPTLFGVTLPGELQISKDIIGLNKSDIEFCLKNAWEKSFLNPQFYIDSAC